ncbi:GNAT family N-acetyltransferase [Yersinia intermedia]|uniref:GNAT family N-acetyltransferase n=1 Tax=Yersinia intermedia TaxID=631 RepID=UPI00119F7592
MGIGPTLLCHIKNMAYRQGKKLILDIIADNEGARRLYERNGLFEIGRKSFILSPHCLVFDKQSGCSSVVTFLIKYPE